MTCSKVHSFPVTEIGLELFQLEASIFLSIMTSQMSLVSQVLGKLWLASPDQQSHPCPSILNASLWSLRLSQPRETHTVEEASCSKPLPSLPLGTFLAYYSKPLSVGFFFFSLSPINGPFKIELFTFLYFQKKKLKIKPYFRFPPLPLCTCSLHYLQVQALRLAFREPCELAPAVAITLPSLATCTSITALHKISPAIWWPSCTGHRIDFYVLQNIHHRVYV